MEHIEHALLHNDLGMEHARNTNGTHMEHALMIGNWLALLEPRIQKII